MLVMKFGGTSLADASRFKDVLNIVRANGGTEADVVVLSAMSGVTNGLIACAHEAQMGDCVGALEKLAVLKARHLQVVDELFSASVGARLAEPADTANTGGYNPPLQFQRSGVDLKGQNALLQERLEADFNKLTVLLQGIAYLGELSKRSLDAVGSCGELLSSQIFAAFAQWQGFAARFVDARSFIVTSNDYGRALPIMPEIISRCETQIMPVIKKGECVITQGFVGATTDGVTTTLGRGGSDYSAALIGAAMDADEIQIWTDVDGMMTADPRLIPEAKPIARVSFQEAAELAYFGAKVLHPLTIKPAVEKNIPVRILNTLNPKSPGTLIMAKVDSTEPSGMPIVVQADNAEASGALSVAQTDNIEPSGNGKSPKTTGQICAIASKKGLAARLVGKSPSWSGDG